MRNFFTKLFIFLLTGLAFVGPSVAILVLEKSKQTNQLVLTKEKQTSAQQTDSQPPITEQITTQKALTMFYKLTPSTRTRTS